MLCLGDDTETVLFKSDLSPFSLM